MDCIACLCSYRAPIEKASDEKDLPAEEMLSLTCVELHAHQHEAVDPDYTSSKISDMKLTRNSCPCDGPQERLGAYLVEG